MKSIKLQIFVVILLSFGELCNQNDKVALRLPKESRTIFFLYLYILLFVTNVLFCLFVITLYNPVYAFRIFFATFL